MHLVNTTVHSSGGKRTAVTVTVSDSKTKKTVASYNGFSDSPFQFTVSSPKLWSPDSPTLYNVTVKMGKDKITSYTGFRTITKDEVNGVIRPVLNGESIFMFGTLDQGYWPDGLYTPPNREAMVFDLKTLKSLGFNMLRKHVSHYYQITSQRANCVRPKRSKSNLTCSTKLATKWVLCSFKTCHLLARDCQMKSSKKSSLVSWKF